MSERLSFPEGELTLGQKLVTQYLRHGSVEESLIQNNYDFPVSVAHYHRIIQKWGIVKSVGRQSTKFSEVLSFLSQLVESNIPLERLYRRMPPSFQTSVQTLHRVLSHIKNGTTRRHGTALVITPESNPDQILIGNDISTPRLDVGKCYGDVSLPMTYSAKKDTPKDAITRVLQQEVFTQNTIKKSFPSNLLKTPLSPLAFVNVADVKVAVYHISFPDELTNFSSFKLVNHRFTPAENLIVANPDIRAGVVESVQSYLENGPSVLEVLSFLNQQLLQLAHSPQSVSR